MMGAPKGPVDERALLSTMDAHVWATEFCRVTGFADVDWALSWFANAIMTGYDEAKRRARLTEAGAPAPQGDALEAPCWDALRNLVETLEDFVRAHPPTISPDAKNSWAAVLHFGWEARRLLAARAPAPPQETT